MQSQLYTIKNVYFDLRRRVVLKKSNGKFWYATYSNLSVSYRVGLLCRGKIINVESVTKTYNNFYYAMNSLVNRIGEKLDKGYVKDEDKYSQQGMEEYSSEARGKLDESVYMFLKYQQNKYDRIIDTGQFKKYRSYNQWQENAKTEDRYKISYRNIELEGYDKSEIKYYLYYQAKNYENSVYIFNTGRQINNELDQTLPHIITNYNKHPIQKIIKPTHSIYSLTNFVMGYNANSIPSPHHHPPPNTNIMFPIDLGPPSFECIKLLLADNYDMKMNPLGWLMSEKLDGVRCFWTGSCMYSRNGNKYNFPYFFTYGWPKTQLDGYLFSGRGKFSQTLSAIKKAKPIDAYWRRVQYLVFDAPALKMPYKHRLEALYRFFETHQLPHLKYLPHRPCEGFDDLRSYLADINKIGGYGIMLRDPNALYKNRRSQSLLKVKIFHEDEATVIGYTNGLGKYRGATGSLRVRNSHGVYFEVGSGMSDKQRQYPPSIGTVITYRYQYFSKDSGKPRFPTLLRCRDQEY